ncbi:hypothetical protein L209DRAFT_758017 [Thermothelomyces heterothallicus CBS 203.75]
MACLLVCAGLQQGRSSGHCGCKPSDLADQRGAAAVIASAHCCRAVVWCWLPVIRRFDYRPALIVFFSGSPQFPLLPRRLCFWDSMIPDEVRTTKYPVLRPSLPTD